MEQCVCYNIFESKVQVFMNVYGILCTYSYMRKKTPQYQIFILGLFCFPYCFFVFQIFCVEHVIHNLKQEKMLINTMSGQVKYILFNDT